jgi:predicted DNA-binding transcriptional regulator AlpA
VAACRISATSSENFNRARTQFGTGAAARFLRVMTQFEKSCEKWVFAADQVGRRERLTSFQYSRLGSAEIMASSKSIGAAMFDHQQQTPRTRAIRLTEVMQLTGASRPTIWRWSRSDPTFPRPFHLSPSITCWDEREGTTFGWRSKRAHEWSDGVTSGVTNWPNVPFPLTSTADSRSATTRQQAPNRQKRE